MIVTPYVVAFTSCTMWLLYGVIIGDRTVININTVGSALQLGYTICYYKFTAKRVRTYMQELHFKVDIFPANFIMYGFRLINKN